MATRKLKSTPVESAPKINLTSPELVEALKAIEDVEYQPPPPKPTPAPVSPFVSREELISAIEQATVVREVCSPCDDYYSRHGDWTRDTITFVDAKYLVELLTKGPVQE